MTQERATRENVITSLATLMLQNQTTHIPYLWWWRTNPEQGFDCSWFIYYTIKQAGIAIDAWCTARGMFQNLSTQRVEYDENNHLKRNIRNIHQGDLLFWNSIDTSYMRSTGPIPEITKEEKVYRIHHIAFIDKINYTAGTIEVFESNGLQWVTKSTINVKHCLTEKWSKNSELYVSHIDYSILEQKKLVPL